MRNSCGFRIVLPILIGSLALWLVHGCRIQRFNIECDCKKSDLDFSQVFEFDVDQSMFEFSRLIIKNCQLGSFTKDTLSIGFGVQSLQLANVTMNKIDRDAFDNVKVIKNYIHQKQDNVKCPTFSTANRRKSDYLWAINSLSNLVHLELCANNNGDRIPPRAFNLLENVRQIYFHGNFSRYSIETNAFAQLNNLESIVFDQMNFTQIRPNAFNLKATKTNDLLRIDPEKNFTSILFQNCSFNNLHQVFNANFTQASNRAIHLTIKPTESIPIQSLRIFENFLLFRRNILIIFNVICDHKIYSYIMRKYWPRLEIDCIPQVLNPTTTTDTIATSAITSVSLTSTSENLASTISTRSTVSTLLNPVIEEFTTQTSIMETVSIGPSDDKPKMTMMSQQSMTNMTSNIKKWFEKLDQIIVTSKSKDKNTELLDFVEKIPIIFHYDELKNEDTHFKQPNTETIIKNFHNVTKMPINNDLIELKQTKKNAGYYVVKTVINNQVIIEADEKIKNFTDKSNNDFQMLNSDVVSYNILEIGQTEMIHDAIIKLRFDNIQPVKYLKQVHCVYWDMFQKQWLPDGCELIEPESNSIISTCQCNHLTSFAVLLDITGREAENPNKIKEILTYICCGFSVIGIAVSLWLMCHMGREKYHLYNDRFRWRMNRWVITLNTAICLLVTNLLTLFGLDQRESEVISGICMTVSVVLLFFLLSSFCFMLLQGYHLFKSTMNPLAFDLNFAYYYMFGYGAPMFIIVLLFAIISANRHRFQDVLISQQYCWISAKNHPYYFLIIIIPIAIAIKGNIIFLIILVINLIRRRCYLKKIDRDNHRFQTDFSVDSGRTSNNRHDICRQTISLTLLAINLGITWLLFIMYIADHMHYFSYIFIIINGSQGVFFLVNQLLTMKYKGQLNFKKMKIKMNKNTGGINTIITTTSSTSSIAPTNKPNLTSLPTSQTSIDSTSNQSTYSSSSTRKLFKSLNNRFDRK